MNQFESRVGPDGAQKMLVWYYSRRFTYHTEAQWHDLLALGHITLNGSVVVQDCQLALNDGIAFSPPPFIEPPADLKYSIIYEDQWILGINKPGNLLVHRNGRSVTHNLIYQLTKGNNRTFPEAGLIHRLDRETSGVIVVAKQNQYLASFSELFLQGTVDKEYVAIVKNELDASPFRVDAPLGPDRTSAIPYKHAVDYEEGKPSCTEFVRIRNLAHNRSFVFARPHTGRTHQIRVHAASCGHPICGDRLYSLSDDEYRATEGKPHELDGMSRQALHCKSLTFTHPFLKSKLTISAMIPADMQSLLE